jgi:hypothetical protein
MAFLSSGKKSTAHASGLTRRQPKLSPAKFSRLRPAFFSLAMAFLSSEKGLGNILKKNSKSTAHASGLTRRQPKLSPAISLSPSVTPPGFHFTRNGVPFVRKKKSTAHASGLTRRQPKLSPANSLVSVRHSARLSFRSQWRSFRQK